MQIAAAAVLLAFMACRSTAEPMMAFGVGNSSCAEWLSKPEHYSTGFTWIMGFWTGRNMQAPAAVGRTTDGHGVVAEVENLCRQEPTLILAFAAKRTYEKLEAEHR